jgi:hypothetical protein
MDRLIEPRILAVLLAAGAALGIFVLPPGPTRAILVLPFFLAAPGSAWCSGAGLSGPVCVAFAIAVSLALDILVATALLLSGSWSPITGFGVLVATTLLPVISSMASRLCLGNNDPSALQDGRARPPRIG